MVVHGADEDAGRKHDGRTGARHGSDGWGSWQWHVSHYHTPGNSISWSIEGWVEKMHVADQSVGNHDMGRLRRRGAQHDGAGLASPHSRSYRRPKIGQGNQRY